jgi:hypothetical protein
MNVVDHNDREDIVISPIGQILDADSPEGKAVQRIYDLKLCHKCGKRKGDMLWGDALAITHGGGSQRCGVCVYTAQLEHALNRTVAIPVLLFKLVRAYTKGMYLS